MHTKTHTYERMISISLMQRIIWRKQNVAIDAAAIMGAVVAAIIIATEKVIESTEAVVTIMAVDVIAIAIMSVKRSYHVPSSCHLIIISILNTL